MGWDEEARGDEDGDGKGDGEEGEGEDRAEVRGRPGMAVASSKM